MMQPLSALIFCLCCGSGMWMVALALPLWLRRVPPNAVYGARFASTLADPQVWYTINARAGRNLALLGASYSIVVGAIAAIPSWNHAASLLGATTLLVIVLIANAVRLSTAASRLHSVGKHDGSQGAASSKR
jgi:hypothetical protein